MADLTVLTGKLGRKVQPDDAFYKFTDEDLADEIMEALVYLDPELTLADLTAHQEMLVMYKARSSCYYALAGKHAENIRFRIENDEYFGNMAYDQYMKMAATYENLFKENAGIQVNTMTRRQTGTGRMAPYEPGDRP